MRGATYDTSQSGWMEGEQLFNWFKSYFLPSVKNKDCWKCLIFDGHHSHISYDLNQLELGNKVIPPHTIVLIVLPPHTTHLLQSLDGPIFKQTKLVWQNVLEELFRNSTQKCVLKTNFASLIKQVVERDGLIRSDAVLAFENCEIYPLNRSKITVLNTEISLTHTNTPLPNYMRSS